MADNITLKRIVDLVAQTDVDETVYTIIDSVAGTVKKYPIGSLICSIAPIFDSTADYLAGAYCNYNGQLYVFTADHDAGAWTGSDVSTVTLTDIAEAHGGDLAELEAAVTALETALDGKADSAGVYENLTAGNALQLASGTGVENSEPYFFRPTPADATREEVEVVGGSVIWHQKASSNKSGGQTPDDTKTFSIHSFSLNTEANHAYFVYGKMTYAGSKTLRAFVQLGNSYGAPAVDVNGASTNKEVAWIVTPNANNTSFKIGLSNIATSDKLTAADAWSYSDLNIIDLTVMLTPTVAAYLSDLTNKADAIAWLKKYFPNIFTSQPYSAPTLKSVQGVSAHKLVGFNQWDGTYTANTRLRDTYDGTTEPAANYGLTDYIPVIPNTTYYNTRTDSGRNLFYDADKNAINPGSAAPVPSSAGTFTTPANCHFVRLTIYVNWLPTFCLNVSDPARNGQYEPYVEHTYPMDGSLTLKGYPMLDESGNLYFDGDVYHPDGTVDNNYSVVLDLGTCDWTYVSSHTMFTTSRGMEDTSVNSKPKGICTKYLGVDLNGFLSNSPDKTFAFGTTGSYAGKLCVRDTNYTDAASFKAAVSGTYIVYKLKNPTTSQATPYTTPQICAPGGTEEWVTTGVVPVGHRTWYPTNQVGKLDGLPADFSTLIAPTEKTTTASRAYSIGDYFILNNTLYKVVSGIASGGTITPGTNCTATTIMAEIAAL